MNSSPNVQIEACYDGHHRLSGTRHFYFPKVERQASLHRFHLRLFVTILRVFRQHVVVVKTDDAEGTLPACDSTQPVSGSSEILDYAQEKVRIRSEAATDAVLVLNDAFYPGWEARLDGANVPILQVNLAVRGVRVPAGSHEVVFEYRPRWLLLSSWVSCLTALGLVISLFVNRPRQVRQGAA